MTSPDKTRPFSTAEYERRIRAARAGLEERGLEALLLFAQESLYYLFGYDGTGYVFFQSVALPAGEGEPVLLCRRPDVAQARDTSSITDIRVWLNAEDACPARELKAILAEMGLKGARVGIELDTYGLTAANYRMVARELEGFCELVDASSLVRGLRLVKSAAEIEHVRRAGALADDAVEAIFRAARPGVLDGGLAAVGLAAILDGGGDPAPGDPLVSSGPKAVYGRSVTGPRPLAERDQLLVELAGTFLRYNCCIERTIVLGAPSAAHHDMYLVVRDTIGADDLNLIVRIKTTYTAEGTNRNRFSTVFMAPDPASGGARTYQGIATGLHAIMAEATAVEISVQKETDNEYLYLDASDDPAFEDGIAHEPGLWRGKADGTYERAAIVSEADAAKIKARFERAVGASASTGNVPSGTFELEVLADIGNGSQNRHGAQRILLSSLSTTPLQLWFRGDTGNHLGVTLTYTATTRTLTYTADNPDPNNAHIQHIVAIGAT